MRAEWRNTQDGRGCWARVGTTTRLVVKADDVRGGHWWCIYDDDVRVDSGHEPTEDMACLQAETAAGLTPA